MPYPAMPTSVNCQNCGNTFTTQIHTIIDVGEEPELKERFLRGEINVATCPECGQGGMLNAPLLYHDPEKELLVSYVPAELGMSADEQEQFVGSLVNSVMNNVPAEERKGYFFQPKTALTLESLYNMILEAEGVSQEMIQQHRSRIQLINQLLNDMEDEEQFDALVDEHQESIDYEFLMSLSEVISAEREGGGEDLERFVRLREMLLERVSPGLGAAASENASYEDLIEMLRETEEEGTWSRRIAMNRQRLDYGFFQTLTSKIEAAQSTGDEKEIQTLSELRERILDEIERQDQSLQEAQDEASLLIVEILQADDREAAIRENLDDIDELFFLVLARLQEAAEKRGNEKRAEELLELSENVVEIMQERLPPDLRLLSALMRAEYPEESNQLLEENRGLLDKAFLETFDLYVASADAPDDDELRERLQRIREQIAAKTEIQRS